MATAMCPTCEQSLPKKTELRYFCSSLARALEADDVMNWYEEVSRLVKFLGAFAQAAPYGVAARYGNQDCDDEWTGTLSWLAAELTDEAERRLDLLRRAGERWEKRAATCRKEA